MVVVFLVAEYKVLAIFVAVVAVLLGIANGLQTNPHLSLAFVWCCCFRCCWMVRDDGCDKSQRSYNAAARTSMPTALKVAFDGGTVMGMTVVGLGRFSGLSTS